MNWQEIDIYLATSDGLFLYNAKANRLEPMLAKDVRAATGTQPFVATAPVNLVYVADLNRTGHSGTEAESFTAADVGFIGENVHLLCASEGPATVVRGSVDRPALAGIMKLEPKWPRPATLQGQLNVMSADSFSRYVMFLPPPKKGHFLPTRASTPAVPPRCALVPVLTGLRSCHRCSCQCRYSQCSKTGAPESRPS